MMIDTHAHLGDDAFKDDLDDVVSRAKQAGVSHCIIVGELPREAPRIREICARYPDWAHGCLGLFPSSFDDEDVAEFERLAVEDWCAFGEIGLDTWLVTEEEDRARHEKVFMHIVELAKSRDLPVNVHSRSCGRRAVELLAQSGCPRVHLHAFDAKPSTIRMGIDAGFYFSIPASIVHSPQKQKLARLVPLPQMLLETDSPVLGPDRTARNEPANIAAALNAVAEIRGISPAELETILDENSRRLYRI